jgi:hypothetical protein
VSANGTSQQLDPPDPLPPDPGEPEPPLPPDPSEPEPSSAAGRVLVELRGSVVTLTGIVERLDEGERIADRLTSLAFVSRVENRLRRAT